MIWQMRIFLVIKCSNTDLYSKKFARSNKKKSWHKAGLKTAILKKSLFYCRSLICNYILKGNTGYTLHRLVNIFVTEYTW